MCSLGSNVRRFNQQVRFDAALDVETPLLHISIFIVGVDAFAADNALPNHLYRLKSVSQREVRRSGRADVDLLSKERWVEAIIRKACHSSLIVKDPVTQSQNRLRTERPICKTKPRREVVEIAVPYSRTRILRIDARTEESAVRYAEIYKTGSTR